MDYIFWLIIFFISYTKTVVKNKKNQNINILSVKNITNDLIMHLINLKKENDTFHTFNRFGNQCHALTKTAQFL